MDAKDLEKIKVYATLTNTLDEYVYLREDEEGTYIEYAFMDGAPHDNRCLSWYYSVQPEAIKRNCLAFGHTEKYAQEEIEYTKNKIKDKIDKLYELSSFTCGHEKYPKSSIESCKESWEKYHPGEEFIESYHICKVGKPAPICIENKTCAHWTYKEPCKCACWNLTEVTVPKTVDIPIDVAIKLFDKILDLKQHNEE